ncbi:group II intron maturase-specific domain-containing protein [Streptomyces malaysiensis]|uniref:group II intron maturase-specific domain-containing protein n=1 Tax=Streptomyces malaysiensis TaxID=92644 RepID=UPI002B2C4D30|nr:group II intron maturase-specific domain-containing protein [Streptomyces malaysiensis]
MRRFGEKLLIKPSKAAVLRFRERLRTEMRSLQGDNAEAVLRRVVPLVRGWAAYYRTVVSTETFASLDHYTWHLTFKWGRRRHPRKSRSWVKARYFDKFNPSRNDSWVFGDRNTGAFLPKLAWTGIVRHRMVKGTASPDDPSLIDYWRIRR